ncbi:hypothetical protein ACFVU3_31290 [Streptomyces sp. NPDC058052]|uniref:hypothetical protein n=1 Tax=Streptomyces sp. NPDC058052 TaxID=3346316 RepID=UPI0036E24845
MAADGRRTRRGITAAALAAALLGGLTACGGDGDDAKPGGGLSAALDGVPAERADTYLAYVDVARARGLVAADRKLYGDLEDYGIPELAAARNEGDDPRDAFGFTAADVDSSVRIGSTGFRLTGRFDPAAAGPPLERRGWKKGATDGGELWQDGDARVAVSSSVRSGAFAAEDALPPLGGPERSLADDPAYRRAVDCLGEDAYLVHLFAGRSGNTLPGVALYGFGARAAEDGTSRERLCVVTESAEAARGVADALRPATAGGETFDGVAVEVGDGSEPVVTMEWANSATPVGLRPGRQTATHELPRLLAPRG